MNLRQRQILIAAQFLWRRPPQSATGEDAATPQPGNPRRSQCAGSPCKGGGRLYPYRQAPVQGRSQVEPSPLPETLASPDTTIQNPEPELEDVFGKDFFATAPVPTEGCIFKEYLDSLHAHRQAARRDHPRGGPWWKNPRRILVLCRRRHKMPSLQDASRLCPLVRERAGRGSAGSFPAHSHYSLTPIPLQRAAKAQPSLRRRTLTIPGGLAFAEGSFEEEGRGMMPS